MYLYHFSFLFLCFILLDNTFSTFLHFYNLRIQWYQNLLKLGANAGLDGRLTEDGEPSGHSAVHFIQYEDDHQVNDGRRRLYCELNVTAGNRVRAHVKRCFHGDAVEDHTEHDGKRDTNLSSRSEKQSVAADDTKPRRESSGGAHH